MVLHLGHLVHRPSGISFFLDFAPASFGFLAKVVWPDAGGGVTPGSAVSRPRVFLVNDVVAIVKKIVSALPTTQHHGITSRVTFMTIFIISSRAVVFKFHGRLSRRKLGPRPPRGGLWRRHSRSRRWSEHRPPE